MSKVEAVMSATQWELFVLRLPVSMLIRNLAPYYQRVPLLMWQRNVTIFAPTCYAAGGSRPKHEGQCNVRAHGFLDGTAGSLVRRERVGLKSCFL